MGFSTCVAAIRPLEGRPWYGRPESDSMDVAVDLDDGSSCTIVVETPDRLAAYLANNGVGHAAGGPELIVRRADRDTVERAVRALAAELSGYWLRVYGASPKGGNEKPTVEKGARVAYSEEGCGVIEARLGDGRRFELLAVETAWFEGAFRRLGLDYYFGPPFVFFRELDAKTALSAVREMARLDDTWLSLYDAPGRTPPRVLEDFRARHFSEARA